MASPPVLREAIGGSGARAEGYAGDLRRRYLSLARMPDLSQSVQRSPGGGSGAGTPGAPPDGLLQQDEEAVRPSLVFALPVPPPSSEAGAEPSQTATEEGGGQAGEPRAEAKPAEQQVDARAVADRVYELMRQEVLLARLRGARK